MASVEEDLYSDDDKINLKKYTFEEVKAMEIEKVFEYIESLYKLLKTKSKKLKQSKAKVKKLKHKLEALEDSKTDKESADKNLLETKAESKKQEISLGASDHELTASTAFDFVNEMRQVAQQAQNINDFVYEPTSGLYYDQKTGYYYNAEYGLYYDGNTGCYYSYNQEKNSFEFHSQVQVQPNNTGGKNGSGNGESAADNYDDDVEFDELGGVITDPEKLKQIKKDKMEQKQKEKDKYKKRNKKEEERAKKKEKRKRSNKDGKGTKKSEEDSNSEDEKRKKLRQADIEEGELSSSSSSNSSSEGEKEVESGEKEQTLEFKRGSRFQDIAKKYPPSLRIIVQETNLDQLKVGSLSIITYKGGSLGREVNNDVIVPDVNVSKCHLKFSYDHKNLTYKCVDLGSRNGTILNGARMSPSQAESEPYVLDHGSVIQIGQTKILCHVHEGNSTCGLCEPGLLIEQTKSIKNSGTETVVLSHKEQLKKLQRKYGLENEKFVDGNKGSSSNNTYTDRAATRRTVVGSFSDKEKTQTASVDTEISSENKGFKMLSKLGWSKGETLGKATASGALLEPINVTSNEGTKGLGCEEPTVNVAFSLVDKKKMESLKKTQERYQKSDNIFLDDSSSDD